MKKLILSLVLSLVLSLIATPVIADDTKTIKDDWWAKCAEAFHITYEAIFAPYDKEWIQYIYEKYGPEEVVEENDEMATMSQFFNWLKSRKWYKEYIHSEHVKMFQKDFMLYFKDYLPAPPKYMGYVGRELFDYLRSNCEKEIRDSRWQYTTVSEMERFLVWYQDKKKPIPIFNDCDDFAQRLNGIIKFWSDGLAQGVYDLEGHERNWVFCLPDELANTDYKRRDCNFYYIEPQSDKLTILNPDEITWIMG